MNEQEQIMDNLLNMDLEIIDTVRDLKRENWDSETLKHQIDDLLNLRDELVEKLMSFNGHDGDNHDQCGCGHDHSHE